MKDNGSIFKMIVCMRESTESSYKEKHIKYLTYIYIRVNIDSTSTQPSQKKKSGSGRLVIQIGDTQKMKPNTFLRKTQKYIDGSDASRILKNLKMIFTTGEELRKALRRAFDFVSDFYSRNNAPPRVEKVISAV